MTAQELIIEAYEHTGEGSDLTPYDGSGVFDITTAGAVKLLQWINTAYKRVASWKFPNGDLLNFSSKQDRFYLTTVVRTGTAQAGTSGTISLDASAPAVANQYRGWLLTITSGTGAGQKRVIVSYSALRVATTAYDWTTTPDSTSVYALYKRFYRFCESADPFVVDNISLSPVTQFRSVLRIRDMQTKTYLGKNDRLSTFGEYDETIGNPSLYVVKNNTIWFNAAVASAKTYEVEYIKGMENLSAATDVPQVPEEFHQVIALLAVWWGLRRDQNWSAAYATKRDIIDALASIRQQEELLMDGEEDYLEVMGG